MLSKATEYAIRAMVYIAVKNRENQRPGYREIAREIEAPAHFTAKILQIMVRQSLLHSAKGRGGGFYCQANDRPVTIIEVIQHVEGLRLFTSCGIGLSQCSDTNPCPIHQEYAVIRNQYQKLAASTTIQSLADKIIRGDAVLNRLL
jgi:Rrf2 family protein